MKVEKIIIKNFKNYSGEVSFDLSKQITILHGDNGFGKSSFFDAIEWCFTNTIDRFDGTEGDIKRDIINRNCDLESTQVSVSIEFGGNHLTRSFNINNEQIGNTQVKIKEHNGKIHRGQENVENFLKLDYFKDVRFGKGAYGQLIKQTYILSQDQVVDFVTSEDSEERYRALVNIMGFKSMLNEADNLKKILSGLKTQDRTFNNTLIQYNESIKSKEETKQVVDIIDMNSKLTQVGIINLTDNVENQCKELEQEIINAKSKNENFLKLYNDLNLNNFKSVSTIIDQITYKENKQQDYLIKVQDSKVLLTKVTERIEGLKKEKQHLDKYNKLRLQIRENENNLRKLEIKELDFDRVNSELRSLRDTALKLEYQISIRQSLTLNLEKIQFIPDENKTLINKNQSILNKKNRAKSLIEKLSNSIDDNKNKILVQLISNVKDIQNYVNKNNSYECPVCSSTPEQGLNSSIEHNLTILNAKIKEDTTYLEKSLQLKNKLEKKMQTFNEEINKISTKIKNNDLLLQRLKEETNKYISNKLYDKELDIYSEEDLKDKLQGVRKQINIHQQGAETLLNLKTLYDNLRDVEVINNTKGQKNFKARLETDLNNSLIRFMKAKNRVENYITNKESLVQRTKSELQNLDLIMLRISEFVSLDEYNKNLIDILSEANNVSQELDSKISVLSKISEMHMALRINSDIEQQINKIVEERSVLIKKKKELNNVIEDLHKHITQTANLFGNEAKDFFNRENSSIQKFYRYLNPLPSNSLLYFESEDEKLDIKVIFDRNDTDNKMISNAKNALSSGQLNVLAISIFLAINESQKTHSLDFIAIDDPIQNMDDVNQYSICDILGHINKQLIISTHDLDFLKLFIKKNEYRKKDIQVYSFMSPYLDHEKVEHIHFT